jgi:hypothetical protein
VGLSSSKSEAGIGLKEGGWIKSSVYKVEQPRDGDGYTWLQKATLFAIILVFTNFMGLDIIIGG